MADLIDRAAAIEALGERPYNWTDSDSEIAEVCAWESHKSAIENVPAVDAIPVEWLREFDLYFAGISGGSPYFRELLEAWQKEQEATPWQNLEK